MKPTRLTFPAEIVTYCRTFYGYDDKTMFERFNGRADTTLREVLPELDGLEGKVMMDIGCGIGGTTAALASALGMEEVHLIEGNVNPSQLMGFREKGLGYDEDSKPWNDVTKSEIMVKANVPEGVKVVGHRSEDLDPLYLSRYMPLRIDLITSFRSWCHHYPARTYLDLVAGRLVPRTGRLVVDVRTDSDNRQVLMDNGFEMVAFVSQNSASEKKTRRYVFRRS